MGGPSRPSAHAHSAQAGKARRGGRGDSWPEVQKLRVKKREVEDGVHQTEWRGGDSAQPLAGGKRTPEEQTRAIVANIVNLMSKETHIFV